MYSRTNMGLPSSSAAHCAFLLNVNVKVSLHKPPCHICSAFQGGALRALSTMCADRESSRRQLLEAKAIGAIVRSLSDPDAEVGSSHLLKLMASSW